MSNIKRQIFDVEYLDSPDSAARVVRVRVIMADRLAAELHGHKHGLMDVQAQPQLAGFIWLFYAMKRQGDIPESTTFDEFQQRALDNGLVKGEDGEPVPPTRESGDSVSGSPSHSPAMTGSTSSDEATTD